MPDRPRLAGLLLLALALATFTSACDDDGPAAKDAGASDDVVEIDDSGAQLDSGEGVDTEQDSAKADTAPVCPGQAGCPCDDNTDCDDDLCIATDAGRRCAAQCVNSCPEGFSCLSVTGGADALNYCVPTWGALCRPCDANSDCEQPGLTNPRCVSHGNEGGFCGVACEGDASCPTGYVCSNAADIAGGESKQCVPAGGGAGGFGACGCSAYAKAQGLGTVCWIEEKGAAGESLLCKGSRQCGAEGLSACKKVTGPAAECVDAQCAGKPDGSKCDDGDPCTSDADDACKAGVCTGGVLICECTTSADCAKKEDGDPCNGTLYCDKSGAKPVCKVNPATVVTCTTTKDTACRKNLCEAATGTCKLTDLPAKTPCSDGDACTGNDACDGKGGCAAGPEDLCQCKTSADCAAKDDGDLCNGTMYCDKAGGTAICKVNPATAITCPTVDDTSCVKNTCQPKTGLCLLQPVAGVNVACEDGNPCTTGETCDKGVCKQSPTGNVCNCTTDADCKGKNGGDLCLGELFCNVPIGKCQANPALAVTCPTVDDSECSKNRCDKKTGQCKQAPEKDGAPCDADGTPCTTGDACKAGQCVAGTTVCVCQSDADCADKEDGNLCNGTLYCDKTGKSPQCKVNPATLKSCPNVDDTACVKNTCQPKTGACAKVPQLDGAPCDDGNPCTQDDACVAGSCTAGLDSCPCKSDAECAKFDEDLCDGPKVCKPAGGGKTSCVDGPFVPVDCSGTKVALCQVAKCAPKTGKCAAVPSKDGATCGDATLCLVGGKCDAGSCKQGTPPNCDDANACTTDACSEGKGCVSTPTQGQPCDDGDACTTSSACGGGACKSSGIVDCDDKNPCTDDACDPKKGCKNLPFAGKCSDGDPCTEPDACVDGKCVAGKAKDCDDNNPATKDSCEAKTGKCLHEGGELCDDIDNDKNGKTDEGCDDDGDGYCDAAMTAKSGVPPKTCPKGGGDCDDTRAWIHPGAEELCGDGLDNDCDKGKDEQCDGDSDGQCDQAKKVVGTVGCPAATLRGAGCALSTAGPIRVAPATKIALSKGAQAGGVHAYYAQVWLVLDAQGKVRRYNIDGKVGLDTSTGVAGLKGISGELNAPVWYGAVPSVAVNQGAIVKVIGDNNVVWKSVGYGTQLAGVTHDATHVFTTEQGSKAPVVYRLDKGTGARLATLKLQPLAAWGAITGASTLLAVGDRLLLPDGPSAKTWHAYALKSAKAIGSGELTTGTWTAAPALLGRIGGRMCALAGSESELRCDVVANWTCPGTDCNDKLAAISPTKTELMGTQVDEDCDGHVDHEADPDADGVCPQAGCALQQEDSCPGIWNPTNDPGRCMPVAGEDGTRSLELELSQPGLATPQRSTRERVHEPVEVPLANGIVNADIAGHWWGSSGEAVTGSGPTMTTQGAGSGDALTTGDGAAIVVVPGQQPLISDANDTLNPPGQELTLGGWFKVDANVSNAVLLSFRYDLQVTLSLIGAGSDLGMPSVSLAQSTGAATLSATEALAPGWHHIAVVVSGKELRLYVGGVLLGSVARSGGATKTATNKRALAIGGLDADGDGKPDGKTLKCRVAELLVAHRAMPPAEVHAWAGSKVIYGSRRTPQARADFDDVRVTTFVGTTERHVPHALVGVRPWSDRHDYGVMMRWSFDRGGVQDAISKTPGVMTGGATAVLGRFGDPRGAVNLYSAQSYVDTKLAGKLKIDPAKESFTLELWVRPGPLADSGTWFGVDNPGKGTFFLRSHNGKLNFTMGGSKNTANFNTQQEIPRGRWVHLAVRYEPGKATYFIDGLRVSKQNVGDLGLIAPVSAPFIGAYSSAGVPQQILGAGSSVDDVILHSRALSDAELRDRAIGLPRVRFLAGTTPTQISTAPPLWLVRDYRLRWGGISSRTEPLQTQVVGTGIVVCDGVLSSCIGYRGYWTMDESVGATAVDLSGNARHGATNQPGAWCPGYGGAGLRATGKMGLSLDGEVMQALPAMQLGVRFAAGTVSKGVLLAYESGSKTGFKLSFDKSAGKVQVGVANTAMSWPVQLQSAALTSVGISFSANKVLGAAQNGATLTGTKQSNNAIQAPAAALTVGNVADGVSPHDGAIDAVRVMERVIAPAERLAAAPLTPHSAWPTLGKVVVPAGRFVQGCDQGASGCKAGSYPKRVFSTSRFAIDRTEVTSKAYRVCVKAGACSSPAGGDACTASAGDGDDRPANCLSRAQAQTYCRWRLGDLPTEAQWAHAARGTCKAANDASCKKDTGATRTYPWGNVAPTCNEAWFWMNGEKQACSPFAPAKVGQLSQGLSPWGCYDMAGNVMEWVRDTYGAFNALPTVDPLALGSGKALVKGGGFTSTAEKLHITYRSQRDANDGSNLVGFRCAY